MKISYSLSNHKQQGAAAVEFALICLLFFTILFAIIEFGRMMYVYNTMQEVTRSAARAAVVRWVDQTASSLRLSLVQTLHPTRVLLNDEW